MAEGQRLDPPLPLKDTTPPEHARRLGVSRVGTTIPSREEQGVLSQYPFRANQPQWFIDQFKRDGVVPPQQMFKREQLEQIYEKEWLDWSDKVTQWNEGNVAFSRIEGVEFFDESVRQNMLTDKHSRGVAVALKDDEKELGKYFQEIRKRFAENDYKRGDKNQGWGYQTVERDDERIMVPYGTKAQEHFIQAFTKDDFDPGLKDEDGRYILDTGSLVSIFSTQTPTRRWVKDKDGTEGWSKDSTSEPLLKMLSPTNYAKFEKEVASRLGLPGVLPPGWQASLGAVTRGMVPFGDLIAPLNEEQKHLMGVLDPSSVSYTHLTLPTSDLV